MRLIGVIIKLALPPHPPKQASGKLENQRRQSVHKALSLCGLNAHPNLVDNWKIVSSE